MMMMIFRGPNFEKYGHLARSNFCSVMEPQKVISCEINGTPDKQVNRIKDLSNALDVQTILPYECATSGPKHASQ